MKHIISAEQFRDRQLVERLFTAAGQIENSWGPDVRCQCLVGNPFCAYHPLRGRIVASLYYEESTRTRFSFEIAARRLGGKVVSTEDVTFSSISKGETLEDTIHVISGGVDAIVLRHEEKGSAKRAAEASRVPLINAGDGEGEHPTQALLDLYTIKKELGTIDNLTICLAGDLRHGRTIHSLIELLSITRGVRIILASPKALELPHEQRHSLKFNHLFAAEVHSLEDALSFGPDVLYMTRVQKKRFKDEELYWNVKDEFILNETHMVMLGDEARVMHPLPRQNEIPREFDTDPRMAYFRQADNGVPIRMALLKYVLER